MAATSTKALSMMFLDTEGTKVQMNISNVNPALTEAEVKTLMYTIIAKNVFASKNRDLKTKKSASIVEKSATELEIA